MTLSHVAPSQWVVEKLAELVRVGPGKGRPALWHSSPDLSSLLMFVFVIT